MPANSICSLPSPTKNREDPAKEGFREAAGVRGANASPIGRSNEERFDQEINYWTNTTPALRATPPLLRRGVLLACQFIHTFDDRAYSRLQNDWTRK